MDSRDSGEHISGAFSVQPTTPDDDATTGEDPGAGALREADPFVPAAAGESGRVAPANAGAGDAEFPLQPHLPSRETAAALLRQPGEQAIPALHSAQHARQAVRFAQHEH